MQQEERRAAKARMMAGMRAGRSWHEAAAEAGVQTSRTAAYRLLQGLRAHGEAALSDGRHGHPSKVRGPVRAWLDAYCRGAPDASGRAIQAALGERFGLTVSVTHLNRVRATLGLSRRAPGAGGKSGPPIAP